MRLRLYRLAALGLLPAIIPAMIPAQNTPLPRFEVASVKESARKYLVLFPQRSGGHITWNTGLTIILSYAFNLPAWRIQGAVPGSDHIYEVDCVTDANATDDQVRQMFQSLLADRFKLVSHRESKEMDGYTLTLGKNGLKLPEAKDGTPPPEMPDWFRSRGVKPDGLEGKVVATVEGPGVLAITGRRVGMPELADGLARALRVPVTDQTGLSGKYYFGLQFAAPDAPDQPTAPDMYTSVQELGLKLARHKLPTEILVVDRIEKVPTEN